MKAYDFEFNNRRLSEFGMILCQFGGSNGVETITDGASISFTTVPTMNGSKHNLTSVSYEDCLEATWQICKHSCSGGIQEITPIEHRNLTAWLVRKKFLKLKILDESNIDLYHEAKIDVSRIEIDGKLYGFELTVKTNRPFALKADVDAYPQHTVDENDEIIYGTQDGDRYQYYSLGKVYKASLNDTSYEEGYIYPQMEITIGNIDDIPVNERNLTIHNSIENREMYIANVSTNEVIILDYPVIQSSDSSHNIQNDFNWTFFRIANTYDNSRNDLVISLPCSIKIKYSPIVKVGL